MVFAENRNGQHQYINSAPPPRDRCIMISIDSSTFMIIWVNKGEYAQAHFEWLTHDLVYWILKWWPQQWQSRKTLHKDIIIYGYHQGFWVCVKSFFCDWRFHSALFTAPCQGIHVQLFCYTSKLMFLRCWCLCVVTVFPLGCVRMCACVWCVRRASCRSCQWRTVVSLTHKLVRLYMWLPSLI